MRITIEEYPSDKNHTNYIVSSSKAYGLSYLSSLGLLDQATTLCRAIAETQVTKEKTIHIACTAKLDDYISRGQKTPSSASCWDIARAFSQATSMAHSTALETPLAPSKRSRTQYNQNWFRGNDCFARENPVHRVPQGSISTGLENGPRMARTVIASTLVYRWAVSGDAVLHQSIQV